MHYDTYSVNKDGKKYVMLIRKKDSDEIWVSLAMAPVQNIDLLAHVDEVFALHIEEGQFLPFDYVHLKSSPANKEVLEKARDEFVEKLAP